MEAASLVLSILALVIAAGVATIEVRTWIHRSDAPWIVTTKGDRTIEFRALGLSVLFDVRATAVPKPSDEPTRKKLLQKPPTEVRGAIRQTVWVWGATESPLTIPVGPADGYLILSWFESTRSGIRSGGLRIRLDTQDFEMRWWRYPWWYAGSRRGRWRAGQD